jgi:magnesium transporter
MPELQWRWGYPAVLCAMGVIFIGMLIYFKKNKWL